MISYHCGEDTGKKLEQACCEEVFEAQRINDGTFAVRESLGAAENEREAKNKAVNDELNHGEEMQKVEQIAKDVVGNPSKVDNQEEVGN